MSKQRKNTLLHILFSILLAFFLWVFAITNTDPTITNSYSAVPVTFINTENLTAGGLMIENSDLSVDVKLYGRTMQISKIKKSDIEAVADISRISSEGKYNVEIIIKGVPENINIVEISPRYVTLNVSKITEVQANYTLDLVGNLANGYAIMQQSADVTHVTTKGSKAATDAVASIRGDLNLSGQSEDFTQTVALHAYDAEGNLLNNVALSPESVEVRVTVGKRKTVEVLPKYSGTPAEGYTLEKITVSPVQVVIVGKEEDLASVNAIPTESVDLTGKSSSFTRKVDLVKPDNIILLSEPAVTVNVAVVAAPLSVREFTFDTIQVRNLAQGLSCQFSQVQNVTVSAEGTQAVLSALNQSDLSVYIDLSGLGAGTHEVELHCLAPASVTAKPSINKVTVTLSEE